MGRQVALLRERPGRDVRRGGPLSASSPVDARDVQLSSSSDRRALDVVDGRGLHEGQGAHYSRRTRDSKTFTVVGREVVLVTRDGRAVWACIWHWVARYGALPEERIRTEIGVRSVRSRNPGYCYERAGYEPLRDANGRRVLIPRTQRAP
jgi:hypothetical protein